MRRRAPSGSALFSIYIYLYTIQTVHIGTGYSCTAVQEFVQAVIQLYLIQTTQVGSRNQLDATTAEERSVRLVRDRSGVRDLVKEFLLWEMYTYTYHGTYIQLFQRLPTAY